MGHRKGKLKNREGSQINDLMLYLKLLKKKKNKKKLNPKLSEREQQ
jgi:hypothetical protein